MSGSRKYKQLKLGIDSFKDHYEEVVLIFRLSNHEIKGILNGTYRDWNFRSNSQAFLKHIPSGILNKYNFWMDKIPPKITAIYNGIWDAAAKAGYELSEKEEWI